MRTVHLVGPAEVSDPRRPSGGNTYHRKVASGLRALGWAVDERLVDGVGAADESMVAHSLARRLAEIPNSDVVLLDGLVAAPVPEVVTAHAGRVRLVLVVHLPRGLAPEDGQAGWRAEEQAVLDAVRFVVTTSEWTRDWLLTTYAVDPRRVRAASPGVESAVPAMASATGRRLLCVGAVTRTKGVDTVVDALSAVADLDWSCRIVGALDIEPAFAARVRERARSRGLDPRLDFTGPLTEEAVTEEYASADLLVLGSRMETYGMVLTEALARGVPVLAPHVGGVPEAMGSGASERRPGLLVPPGDVDAYARALRGWLSDADLRESLRSAAAARRATLPTWSDTAVALAQVLSEVAA